MRRAGPQPGLQGEVPAVEGPVVVVEEGDSFKGVYGGYAFKEDGWGEQLISGSSQANGNTVTINGGNIFRGKLGGLYSKYGVVAGAWANYTSDNTVIIEGGNIETHIYGGYSMVSGNEDEVGGVNSENYVDKINSDVYQKFTMSSLILTSKNGKYINYYGKLGL